MCIRDSQKHVEIGIEEFNKTVAKEIEDAEFAPADQGNLGAQVSVASNLISSAMQQVDDDDMKVKVSHLKALVERGVITSIAMKLQRMARLLSKGKTDVGNPVENICNMATKYEPYYQSESDSKKTEESAPEIILSESFR